MGEDALAAVGTSNPLMTLAILFINGMCLGAGILVSTAFGAGDTQLVERQVSTTAIAGTVFSLTFSACACCWQTRCCGCCRCLRLFCPLR